MPLRVLVVGSVVNPAMTSRLAPPLVAMAVGAGVASLLLLRRSREGAPVGGMPMENPLELGTALRLAAVLVVILLLAGALRDRAGAFGVYALSVVSGTVDVDAITLSLSGMARTQLSADTASRGICLAVVSNTAFKMGIAAVVGGAATARLVAVGLGLSLAFGAVALLV